MLFLFIIHIYLWNLSSLFCCCCSVAHVWLFAIPWTAACQLPCLSPSPRSLKLMSVELVMPSNHLVLCHPLFLLPSIFPSIGVFSSKESALCIRWPKHWTSALVLPMNIQDWFPLGLTGLISSLSKGFSRVFSNTIIRKHQFSAQPSLWSNSHICTWLPERLYGEVTSLSHVQLFVTPWTVAYKAPPSMGFSRQEYCSGVPLPSPMLTPSQMLNFNEISPHIK